MATLQCVHDAMLGPPVVPLYPFFLGRVPLLEIDKEKSGYQLICQPLKSGGPRQDRDWHNEESCSQKETGKRTPTWRSGAAPVFVCPRRVILLGAGLHSRCTYIYIYIYIYTYVYVYVCA